MSYTQWKHRILQDRDGIFFDQRYIYQRFFYPKIGCRSDLSHKKIEILSTAPGSSKSVKTFISYVILKRERKNIRMDPIFIIVMYKICGAQSVSDLQKVERKSVHLPHKYTYRLYIYIFCTLLFMTFLIIWWNVSWKFPNPDYMNY